MKSSRSTELYKELNNFHNTIHSFLSAFLLLLIVISVLCHNNHKCNKVNNEIKH